MCCHCEGKEGKCSSGFWHLGNKVGLFFVFLQILCFVWLFVHPVDQGFHVPALKAHYLLFNGLDVLSMVLALVQIYVFGYIVSGLWWLAGRCGWCCGKCKVEEKKSM